jgi:hypothetical protein
VLVNLLLVFLFLVYCSLYIVALVFVLPYLISRLYDFIAGINIFNFTPMRFVNSVSECAYALCE